MSRTDYDIVVVGGGLGGAAFAVVMAKAGARVLVVERETHFQDRIRGEFMEPWGVAETRRLGIYDAIRSAANDNPFWQLYLSGMKLDRRDIVATTPHNSPNLAIYHLMLQELVLAEAAKAGAEVRRGAKVCEVKPGNPPAVAIESKGRVEELSPRLVVGADGRSSMARKWCGFATKREPDRYYIAGLLFEQMSAPEDTAIGAYNPTIGQVGFLFPQGDGRVRAYDVYPIDADFRLQGENSTDRFVAEALNSGVPPEYYKSARASGPLASFISADHWVESPYRDGVVLIGDAASASDPIFGQGLSLTCRDVRVLTDFLRENQDWAEACRAYAQAHDQYFTILREADNCLREILVDRGPEADARRARALPRVAQGIAQMPDQGFCGPDKPFDEGRIAAAYSATISADGRSRPGRFPKSATTRSTSCRRWNSFRYIWFNRTTTQ
jgi:2-polyprenyl-6-methoxyphenol hydroxylase-like FAD-dependent oxidoreductase